MMGSKPPSFFAGLQTRELNGFRVRKRPYLGYLDSDFGGFDAGVVAIEHEGVITPPLAVSFSKIRGSCHFLAVSDEDGYISIYDTRRKLLSLNYCRENAEKGRVCEWVAHHNAIFDICWIKDDTQILTASGDQTIKIWDFEKKKCLGAMMGHMGSVKSLCSHPSNPVLLVSGSRDGSFALWDMRCKPSLKNKNGEICLMSTAVVQAAHVSAQRKQVRRGKVLQAANMSVTSVLYLKDEISVATAGAADSIVKFWDSRNLKGPCMQSHPHCKPPVDKGKGQHGISSLSQDTCGVFIAASCMDNRIYLHDVLRLDKGPVSVFSGSQIESFYVKSAISPDAAYILGGSSNGNAYLWKVQKPEARPVTLNGHEGEVTAVDWCPSEIGKIATSSDDFTVRIWNICKGSSSTCTKSPSSMRKRVTAIPSRQGRKLIMDEPQPCYEKEPGQVKPGGRSSTNQMREIEVRTPESAKRKHLASIEDLQLQKTPDSASTSPSSVLNPPTSLKRKTIRDYFLAKS